MTRGPYHHAETGRDAFGFGLDRLQASLDCSGPSWRTALDEQVDELDGRIARATISRATAARQLLDHARVSAPDALA